MRETRTVVKIYGNPEKPFGTLYSDGIYETMRETKAHFFRKFGGYGVSDWILDDLKKEGCVYIRIEERGAYARIRFFKSPIEKWFSFAARPYTWEGNLTDSQHILPLREMVKE